jgi:hypothetical protein
MVGVGHTGRRDCSFEDDEPPLDVADRLNEIPDGRFDAREAVVHDAIMDVSGRRSA